jgi:hypothetical protein
MRRAPGGGIMGMGERVRTRLKQSGQGGERMPNIIGGCLCGSVRYESEAEPTLTAVCHCRHCQKQTSSAFSIFIVLPKGSLRIEGEALAAFEDVGESGLPVFRKFCTKCGSAIVSEAVATPALEWLNAGRWTTRRGLGHRCTCGAIAPNRG